MEGAKCRRVLYYGVAGRKLVPPVADQPFFRGADRRFPCSCATTQTLILLNFARAAHQTSKNEALAAECVAAVWPAGGKQRLRGTAVHLSLFIYLSLF